VLEIENRERLTAGDRFREWSLRPSVSQQQPWRMMTLYETNPRSPAIQPRAEPVAGQTFDTQAHCLEALQGGIPEGAIRQVVDNPMKPKGLTAGRLASSPDRVGWWATSGYLKQQRTWFCVLKEDVP